MTDNITVSRELLRQVLNAACSPYCAQDLGQLMPAIRAALEQAPVQEPVGGLDDTARIGWAMWRIKDLEQQLAIRPAPVQEPAAEILSDVIHRNAKKLVFTHHGLSLPVGTMLYTATQPAPASKPVLLQCLGCERVGTQEQLSASTDCDCWLHTQPAPVQEPQCNPHPKAPHGFDRNASHSSHRYVCDCESWEPYDAGYNEGFHAGLKAEQALSELSAQTQEMEAQPRKAVKLSDYDVGRLTVFDGLHHVETPLLAEFIRAIEQAVWAKLGVTE